MIDNEDRVDTLEREVYDLKTQLARYRGFVGGVIFVCGAVVTFIEVIWPWLKGIFVMKVGS